jgi:hypothetical protein
LLWRKTGKPGNIDTEPWPQSLEEDVRVRKERLEKELGKAGLLSIGPAKGMVAAVVPEGPPNQRAAADRGRVIGFSRFKLSGRGPGRLSAAVKRCGAKLADDGTLAASLLFLPARLQNYWRVNRHVSILRELQRGIFNPLKERPKWTRRRSF